MGNEMSIKVGKSKKTLNFLKKSYNNPIDNGVNFVKIHVDAISKNDVTQEFHFNLVEFTLPQFCIKSNLSKLLQNQMYMAFMVLHVL
jgi:hypothetical protein